MVCRQCGKVLDETDQYCSNCGYSKEKSLQAEKTKVENEKAKEIKHTNVVYINKARNYELLKVEQGAFGFVVVLIFGIAAFLYYIILNQDTVYISDESYNEVVHTKGLSYTNQKENVNIINAVDANNVISEDGVSEKNKCATSEEIKTIENNIANTAGITSVSLCNISLVAATEIEKTINNLIYTFPGLKGSITNLVFTNQNEDFISKYISTYQFLNSLSDINIYPWVIKSQIIINGNLYTDTNLPNIDALIRKGSATKYFIPNSTFTTPVVFEYGHALIYQALKKSVNFTDTLIIEASKQSPFTKLVTSETNGNFYKNIVNEAYSKYSLNHPGVVFSTMDFIKKISLSSYNLDENENIKYEDIIAAAFTDCFINGNMANPCSIAIMNVLRERL